MCPVFGLTAEFRIVNSDSSRNVVPAFFQNHVRIGDHHHVFFFGNNVNIRDLLGSQFVTGKKKTMYFWTVWDPGEMF